MKAVFKSILVMSVVIMAGCSSQPSGYKRLNKDEIDQKSYAVAYASTVQTYTDRVNESYDIDAYMRGMVDWYNKKVTLPVEQIRGSLMNRMLDHNVYAYYSGVLDASQFQANANRLSPKCWAMLHTPSVSEGTYDAMLDLQKGKPRLNDSYIKQGADQLLHECVEQIESEHQQAKQAVKKAQKSAKPAKKSAKAK